MQFDFFRSTPLQGRWAGLWIGLLAVALILTGCDSNGGGNGGDDMPDNPTITELAANQDNLSTLVSSLQEAGLDDDLNDEESTFTVFAPPNSAFENIDAGELTDNPELLSEVLEYHVVPGQAIEAGDIEDGQTVETLEGETLEFSVDGNSVQVNGASVTSADLQASNGVVHVIDEVLLETVDAVDRAVLTPQLSTLATAVDAAGLAGSDSPLRNETLTLFAPADGSFGGLKLDALTNDAGLLGRILQYHAVPGSRITSDQISGGEMPSTLEGGSLNIAVDDGTVTVNGIPVSTTDIQTENATIHLIDGVLLQRIDIVERASITEGLETLTSAVQAAGLDAEDSPLRNDNPVTTFAPTNSAFDPLDVDALTGSDQILNRVLPYHVLSGEITSDDLSSGDVETLEGGSLTVEVTDEGVTVNGIPVTTTDIQTRNGVIHLIDGVLLERIDIVERATITPSLSTLTSAVQAAGLDASDSPLRNSDPATVFAPINGAFDPLDVDELTGSSEILNRVLPYHAVSGEITSDQLSDGDVETLEGGSITIQVGDQVTVNGIPVTTTDIETRNGVVHLIEGVLLERLDVVQRATVTSSLSTLTTAVGEAGLAGDLKGDGPFTVFAPVDSAFADYNVNALTNNQDLLQRVLTYHVIGQEIRSGDLSEGESPQTLEGGTITIGLNGNVTLNGRVTVTVTDIEVRNGVIHLLDDVLLRRTNAVQRALVTPEFSILADLVAEAGLADDLSQEDAALTVFAPTNDAFLAALDENDNGEIDDGEIPDNAQSLLQYHVGDGVFYAADEPTDPSGTQIPDGDTNVSTLEGSDVLVRRDGSSVTLNPETEASSVIAPDVDITNGVIHGIDTVLSIPSSSN